MINEREEGRAMSVRGVAVPHWYRIYVDDGCVLCGAGGGETRERVYGPKPEDPAERYVYSGDHACSSHFM